MCLGSHVPAAPCPPWYSSLTPVRRLLSPCLWNAQVHALVVPNTDLYSEEAVVGTEPALADGQVLLVADALRCYCEQSDCRLGKGLRVFGKHKGLCACVCVLVYGYKGLIEDNIRAWARVHASMRKRRSTA